MRQPEIYDALVRQSTRSWDAAHYIALVSSVDGAVLELGVGTGRLFLEFLRSGVDAYGIDDNPKMLDWAHAKVHDETDKARLSLGSALELAMERQFKAIIAPYNFLSLIRPSLLPTLLSRIRSHLLPGGFLALDILVADSLPWSEPPHEWNDETLLEFGNRKVKYAATGRFNPTTRIHVIEEVLADAGDHASPPHTERLELYQWTVTELESGFADQGWSLLSPPKTQSGTPFSTGSPVYAATFHPSNES